MSDSQTTPNIEPQLPLCYAGEDDASKKAGSTKKILVLGATSGMAEATCRLWANRGDHLFLVARSADKLTAVAADMRVRGAGFVDTAVADLDDTAKHPELLAHAVNSLAGLDIAFLALGVLGDAKAAEQSFTEANRIV